MVDIIKTQLANDKTVDELVIAFILRETMEVIQYTCTIEISNQ